MKNVDVHLLVKNEIELIGTYLAQFKHWETLGNIVAVDTGSTDGTFDLLLTTPGVIVVAYPLDMNFSIARNVKKSCRDSNVNLSGSILLRKFLK